jgi:hypothetical protein
MKSELDINGKPIEDNKSGGYSTPFLAFDDQQPWVRNEAGQAIWYKEADDCEITIVSQNLKDVDELVTFHWDEEQPGRVQVCLRIKSQDTAVTINMSEEFIGQITHTLIQSKASAMGLSGPLDILPE